MKTMILLISTPILTLILIPTTPRATAQEPARLRAKAALALAWSASVPRGETYGARYAVAVRESKPLLVWVGQPARPMIGCIHHEVAHFPGTGRVAVIVGVPTGMGTLHRVDLPGRPSDADIRAALGSITVIPGSRDHIPATP